MKVIKRNGTEVDFDKCKIEDAIYKAMLDVNSIRNINTNVSKKIAGEIEELSIIINRPLTIEEIQDLVEDKLIENKECDVAKSYIKYRYEHSKDRNMNNILENNIIGILDSSNDEILTENSNKQGELASTQRDLMAGEVSKDIARRRIIPPHLNKAEDEGIIKIHDKDYLANNIYNCELINISDMLQNGTVINKKTIRKPKSLRTAMTVVTQISLQVSSLTYGGQTISLSHIAPFVRESEKRIKRNNQKLKRLLSEEDFNEFVDGELRREIKDSVQLFNYQINTMMGANGQSPFCSVAMYISEDKEYEKETVMLIEEFLKQRIAGMENEFGVVTSQTFPKLLYFLDENNIHDNSKYSYLTDLACESVAKRLSPDFISVKKMMEYYGTVFPPMGCRAFLTPWINPNTGKYDMYGRGNLGVTTINLVDIALSCNKDINKFYELMDERLDMCKEMGIIRYEKMKGVKARIAPILWQHGAISRLNADDNIIKAIDDRKFTVTIGYCGLHETVKYITGESLSSEKGKEFGIEIMKYMDSYKDKIKDETGLLFAIYGTPSESTAGWFADKMQAKYGDIDGITNKGWITNSYHIDIQEKINAFDKLRIEDEFAKYSLGGTISYVEIPNLTKNIKAVRELVKYMYNHNIYGELNSESDTCSTCKFSGVIGVDETGLKWKCPQCGENNQEKLSVIRRTCGYISETVWSKGRMLDIINRVKHL